MSIKRKGHFAALLHISLTSFLVSYKTEDVTEQKNLQPNSWRTLTQSVTGIDNYCTNQSNYDTPEESEPLSTSGKASIPFQVNINKIRS